MIDYEYEGVYIMGNKRPTLYIGVTNNLIRRIWEHQNKKQKGFTQKYGLDMLLYYKRYNSMEEAILKEKQMKKFSRQQKLELIGRKNPSFLDLSSEIFELIDSEPAEIWDENCYS
jgi:putative endonuclease